ncbi:aminoacyl-tRNA hydrolase [Bacillus sp. REN10]|uniref:aminoacyl-tRNA hydrolase n=1 Tax=Bacillus sp. REN10 TaxID=2782541 RepID=UPI00193AF295|nr:aminoacyl-tRNA hydrolase [Bacillus sp. REN10]
MKLIVGLGNPGSKYDGTRHNIGFDVIDELANRFQVSLTEAKHKGIYAVIRKGTEKAILLKPLTYMNLSGESIGEVMRYYNIDIEDLLVIYDDLDLPVGKIRLRQKGSAGGHNGIKSTIAHMGTQEFNRIRIGIDRPKGPMKVPDYVLGRFTAEEQESMKHVIATSADAAEAWLEQSFLEVMNKFNQ